MRHRWSMGVRLLLTLAILLSAGLTTYATPVQAASTPLAFAQQTSTTPTLPYAQAKKQMDDAFKQIGALRKLIDRSQFDLGALGFALGGDAEKISDFMRNEIAFEQYPGLLRGAQGTLLSRAGNALDQAVLLQQLLLDAGYETKLQHGSLTSADAKRLLKQMFIERKESLPISKQMDRVKKLLTDLAGRIGMSSAESSQLLDGAFSPQPLQATAAFSTTEADSQRLETLLADARVNLGDSEAETKLVAEAQDYFWVEYRLGPTDKWTSLHPAFGNDKAPANLKASETFADESKLPDSLRQRLHLEVSIERKVGDALETQVIVPSQEATIASMIGKTYSFAMMPDGIAASTPISDPAEMLAKSNFFFPSLNGKLMKDAQAVDRYGNIAAADVASSPLAGLVSGISGSLGGALDALGGGEDTSGEQQQFLLTAAYVDFTFSIPGQPDKTVRRTLVDRLGAANRAAERLELANPDNLVEDLTQLTAKLTFMVAAGSYAEAYTFDRQLEYYQSLRPLFDLVLKSDYQKITQADLNKAKLDKLESFWPGHLNLYPIFDRGARTIDALNYRPEASLVIHRQEQRGESTRVWIDVVNNSRRTYQLQGDQIVDAPQTLLKTGVWETMSEGSVLPLELSQPMSTMAVFAQADQEKIKPLVITPEQSDQVDALKISAQAKANLHADLAAGNVVVLPSAQPKALDLTGWWRIDPHSGQTLGMLENGMGTAMVEYIITLVIFGTCLAAAGGAVPDSNGISVQDLIVCGTLALGGFAAMPAKITARVIIGLLAGAAGTGLWLNNSPWLQNSVVRP